MDETNETSHITENLSKLKNQKISKESLLEAIKLKDKIEPHLLSLLDDVLNQKIEPDNMLYTYSLWLLAYFKCNAAYNKIINILKLPYEQIEDIYGSDFFLTDFSNIIISVYNGDYLSLIELVENTKLDYNNRMIALECVCYLTKNNHIDLNKTIGIIKQLAQEREITINFSLIAGTIFDAYFYLRINDDEYLNLVKKLYEDDLIDCFFFGTFNERLSIGYDGEFNCGDLNRIYPIEDIVKTFSCWRCFDESDNNNILSDIVDNKKQTNEVSSIVKDKKKKKNKRNKKNNLRW